MHRVRMGAMHPRPRTQQQPPPPHPPCCAVLGVPRHDLQPPASRGHAGRVSLSARAGRRCVWCPHGAPHRLRALAGLGPQSSPGPRQLRLCEPQQPGSQWPCISPCSCMACATPPAVPLGCACHLLRARSGCSDPLRWSDCCCRTPLQVGCSEFGMLLLMLAAESPCQRLKLLHSHSTAMYSIFSGGSCRRRCASAAGLVRLAVACGWPSADERDYALTVLISMPACGCCQLHGHSAPLTSIYQRGPQVPNSSTPAAQARACVPQRTSCV